MESPRDPLPAEPLPAEPLMVLDGAQPVDAGDPCFSAPLGGLLAGQAVQVHVVAWTEHGPQAFTFTLPRAAGVPRPISPGRTVPEPGEILLPLRPGWRRVCGVSNVL
jgi:hypothetical protein